MKTYEVICPYCNKPAVWCENKVMYKRNYGKSYMCYYCADCDAYVGCHNNTRNPLGTMANKELREWRKQAHAVVDPLWKSGQYRRGIVYRKLGDYFHKQIHIAESDVQQCQEIIKAIPNLFTPPLKPELEN